MLPRTSWILKRSDMRNSKGEMTGVNLWICSYEKRVRQHGHGIRQNDRCLAIIVSK
jgi:hypothetical protein